MAELIRVLGLVGSLRRDSLNRKLLANAVQLLPDGMTLETHELGELPPYNTDLEEGGFPDRVRDLHKAIGAVDAILFVTPEYNHGIPGLLKNAIDWASRPPRQSTIYGKPAGVLGASPGIAGTARAQIHLRQHFVYLNMPFVAQPEVLVARANDKFDEDGNLTDEVARKLIRQHLEALRDLVLLYRMRA